VIELKAEELHEEVISGELLKYFIILMGHIEGGH